MTQGSQRDERTGMTSSLDAPTSSESAPRAAARGARARPTGCTRAGGRAGNRQDTPPRSWRLVPRRATPGSFGVGVGARARAAVFGVCACATSTSGALTPTCLDPRRDAGGRARHVLPSLSALAAGRTVALQHERHRSHRAVRALLEHLAQSKPLVLVLDDFHWADAASVELLLGALLRRPPGAAVLIAVALRPRQTPERLPQRSSGRTVRRR